MGKVGTTPPGFQWQRKVEVGIPDPKNETPSSVILVQTLNPENFERRTLNGYVNRLP